MAEFFNFPFSTQLSTNWTSEVEIPTEEGTSAYLMYPMGSFIQSHQLMNISHTSLTNLTTLYSIEELPIEMQFNQGHLLSIIVYSILFVIAAIGNITLLITIIRIHRRSRLGRVNLFLLHLAMADLTVTFLLMPLEIGWAATVRWTAGDFACRVLSFFRTFGLYLSGFMIICISVDRYFAVLKPLTLPEADDRGKIMLSLAWVGSIFCSLPQAYIFHVERHPQFQWYEQCVTFNSFPSRALELAYSLFGFILMYGFPLVMIIFCYTCIIYEIFKIHQIHRRGEDIRRTNIGTLGRAKIRTLKMTVVIVSTFTLCWAPYNIMSLWYWIDTDSASKVDQRIQKSFFLFAVTNSCFNPIVYGLFHIRRRTTPSTVGNNPQSLRNAAEVSRQHPFRFRVRWRSHGECMCSANGSGSTSSNPSRSLRGPMYEVNGLPLYLNNNGNNFPLRQFSSNKSGDQTQRNPHHLPHRHCTGSPFNFSNPRRHTSHLIPDETKEREFLNSSSRLHAHEQTNESPKHYGIDRIDTLDSFQVNPTTTQLTVHFEVPTSPTEERRLKSCPSSLLSQFYRTSHHPLNCVS